MTMFNLPCVVIMCCLIYGEETRKKYSEGIVCNICRRRAGQSIHLSSREGEFKIVGMMGRYDQISVLHILSLLHVFVAQSEARELS